MRDVDRLKDKTVLALDSRQLFFVFFGGSVAAALLFALGILVGRRLPAEDPGVEEDPLAMLDQLGAEEEALSFQKGLKGRATPPPPPPAAPAAEAGAAREPEAPVEPPKPPAQQGPPAPEPRPAAPAPTAARSTTPAAEAVAADSPAKPTARRSAAPPPAPAEPPPGPSPAAASPAGRFTLQLSSFQEKGEAAEFMGALGKKGYETYLISAEVPGRGLWYRVRLGDYPTHDDALAAKAEFERKQRIIAYVLRK
jgi:septal ring-binding cell division protein DamX